jgi:hypothetical protein
MRINGNLHWFWRCVAIYDEILMMLLRIGKSMKTAMVKFIAASSKALTLESDPRKSQKFKRLIPKSVT